MAQSALMASAMLRDPRQHPGDPYDPRRRAREELMEMERFLRHCPDKAMYDRVARQMEQRYRQLSYDDHGFDPLGPWTAPKLAEQAAQKPVPNPANPGTTKRKVLLLCSL